MERGEFKKDGAHNFLRLPIESEVCGDEIKMLEENEIEGLLSVTQKSINGQSYLYYETGSLQSLENLYCKRRCARKDVAGLFRAIVKEREILFPYFLDEAKLVLDERYIYADVGDGSYRFVYDPYAEASEEELGRLFEFLLDRLAEEDEGLTEAVYTLYDMLTDGSFSWKRALLLLEENADTGKREADRSGYGFAGEARSGFWRQQDDTSWEDISPDGEDGGAYAEAYEKDTPYPAEGEKEEDENSAAADGGRGRRVWKVAVSALCVVTGFFFLGLLFFCELSVQEEILLCAGFVAVLGTAFVSLLTFRSGGRGKRKKEEAKDDAGNAPRLMRAQTDGERAEETDDGRTRYIEFTEEAERRLYGIGKNKAVIRLERLPFIIGKNKEYADYVLSDASVSRLHVKLTEKEGELFLTDLNSTNGTFKNGLRLEPNESVRLEREDEIRIGRLEFCYR